MGGGGREGAGGVWARFGSGEETRARWDVGGGGGEGVGGCGHALATFKYSLNTLEMRARCE